MKIVSSMKENSQNNTHGNSEKRIDKQVLFLKLKVQLKISRYNLIIKLFYLKMITRIF